METQKTILVVDDEAEVLAMIESHFSLRGYEVLKAADGGRAPRGASLYGLGPGDNPVFPGVWEVARLIAGGSILAAETVASGEVERAFHFAGGLHHAVQNRASGFCYVNDAVLAILRGADIRFLGLTAKIFPYTLVTKREIKTGKDLRGGKIAINKLADVSEIASRLALKELALGEKDVTMVQVGGSPQRLAALQSGNVQGAALDFMSGLKLAKEGYNILIQISPSYPYLGLLASGKFMREKPAATEAFVKAFVEAVARFKSNRDEGIKVIAHYMKSSDMEIVGKAYDFIATKFYAENLQPDAKSFQSLLEELSAREPQARNATVHQFFDLKIVNKLEQEGFFKSSFKK